MTASSETPAHQGLSVFFLVSKLGGGGAERQLALLATGLAKRGHRVSIGVYRRGGDYEEEITAAGVTLVSFDKRSFWDLTGFMSRVIGSVRSVRPDIIHGYMDTGNIVAAVLRGLAPNSRVVWGVRSSSLDLSLYDRAGRILFQLTRPTSRLAHLIIANSRSGADHVIASGYPRDRVVVIPNGIDVAKFRPDPAAGERLRVQLGIASGVPLIGMAARLDPMKGHDVFTKAATILLSRCPSAAFVCAGEGMEPYRSDVLHTLHSAGLGERLKWIGAVRDMPTFYSALTVAACCSRFGEGFSNAIAEAMACGVPCAVTDVGDLPLVVGDTGAVVPRDDPAALAQSWALLITQAGAKRSELCRARVVEQFSVASLVDSTEMVLRGLLQ